MKVTRLECVKPDWKRVLNAARRTWGKQPIDKEPSVGFKKSILLAEHSPIRLLEYDFTISDIRQWVTVHLVRHHEGCEKFVHTQRQDINDEIEKITKTIIDIFTREGLLKDGWRERDYLFQGQENDVGRRHCHAFRQVREIRSIPSHCITHFFGWDGDVRKRFAFVNGFIHRHPVIVDKGHYDLVFLHPLCNKSHVFSHFPNGCICIRYAVIIPAKKDFARLRKRHV